MFLLTVAGVVMVVTGTSYVLWRKYSKPHEALSEWLFRRLR